MARVFLEGFTTPVQISKNWEANGAQYIAFLGKGVLFIIDGNPSDNQPLKHTFVLSGSGVTLKSECITVNSGIGSVDDGTDLAFQDSDLRSWFDKLRSFTKRHYADVIEEIEVRGKLGRGSFAGVTRGRIRNTGEEVAVKRFEKFWINSEIFACVALKHPNIVSALDVLFDGNQLCIVMPVVNGGKLSDFVKRASLMRIEEKKAQEVMRQILKAVLYMHQLGITHNDLHMGNILCDLQDDGSIKPMIIDFGMCAFTSRSGVQNDLRFCGEAVYYMLTGKRLPYEDVGLISTEIGRHASKEACEFVFACMGIRGTSLTSEEALKNNWLAQPRNMRVPMLWLVFAAFLIVFGLIAKLLLKA